MTNQHENDAPVTEDDPTTEHPVTRYSTDPELAAAWHLRAHEDVPLPVAAELAEMVTEACRWFHEPKHLFLGDPTAPHCSDAVVDEVCRAMQHQLDREGKSRTGESTCSRHGIAHTHWYQLMDLPPARRRALVERIWALKERHGITVRVWSHEEPLPERTPVAPFVTVGD